MANIKIYSKGNYVIIEDSVSGLYKESKSSDVMITKSVLASTTYNIRTTQGDINYLNQAIAEIQDEAGVAYADQATFERWYQQNTGGEPMKASQDSSSTRVASSDTSATLIAENLYRKGVFITNSSDKKAFILIGGGTALLEDDHLIDVDKALYIETTELITFITEASPTGNIIVTELY